MKLINELIRAITDEDSIVMDFFGGSSSTAHAVMELNAEDEGCRRFIIVQIPEKTDPGSAAYKCGYKNICDIGRARICIAADRITNDLSEERKDKIDIGYKVFGII